MATSSIEVTNGSNFSSQSFASQRVNSLDDPLVFDENNLKIMSELASNLPAVPPPHNKVFTKCLSQINSSSDPKNNSTTLSLTDDIEDLFEAYNISSDDLTNRYKIAEEHITSELNEMFVERERLRGQMQPFMNGAGGGAQSTLQVCYVPAIATSSSSQSVITGSHQDSVATLKLSGKVNSNSSDLLPPNCFNGISKTSNLLANSMLENIQIKDECGSFLDPVNLEAKGDSRLSIPRNDVMEKSLFINLSFKAGFNSAGWDSSPPPSKNGRDVENGAKSIYRCVECGAAYASRTALFYHYRRRIQNVKQLQCNKCVLPISNECASRAHNRIHFLTGPFVCFICGESYSGDSMLLQHIDTHGVECRIQNNIACHACRLVFISKEHLVKHRDSSHCIASEVVAAAKNGDVNGSLIATEPNYLKLGIASESEVKGVTPVNSSSLSYGISASVGFVNNSHKSANVSSSSPSGFVPMKKPSSSSAVNNYPSNVSMTNSGGSNGTTCHLCQKVLSRRDKLKWHLAICAPRFQVDLYDHLLLAGFSESVARNVVLGSNCAVRCRKCSARFSTRSGLEEHESVCAPDPNRSDASALKGIGEESSGMKPGTNANGVSLGTPTSCVTSSSIYSASVSDRKGVQLGGMTSSPNAVLANGGSSNSTSKQISQQLPAMDRLTCHLCNRTLSRRDKLKRHLVRCCEMYGRDVEIALNVAGFTSKDVDKILGINNSVAINGSALNNVGTLSAPLPTQCPTSSLQNIDTFAFEDVGAVPQSDGGLVIDVSKKSSNVIAAPPIRPVATEKLTKYHLSPENIPVPPSFCADISSLVSPTNFSNVVNTCNGGLSSPSSTIIAPQVAVTAAIFGATNPNLLAASSSSFSQNIQSCQLSSCSSSGTNSNSINSSALDSNSNFTMAKNSSHNQTTVPSLEHVPSFYPTTAAPSLLPNGCVSSVTTSVAGTSAVEATPVSPKSDSNKEEPKTNAKNEQLDLEMGEILQEMWDKKPSVKRIKYNCEKCGEIFSYKLAFSKHTCQKNDVTK